MLLKCADLNVIRICRQIKIRTVMMSEGKKNDAKS